MRRSPLPLLACLLASVSLVLAACGGGDDPAPVAGNGVDRAFVAAMVPHHEEGVAMARQALERSEDPEVRDLAEAIAEQQAREVRDLRAQDAELARAGVQVGELGVPTGHEDHSAALDDTRRRFDVAWLDAMVVHHSGAITMATAHLRAGEDPELRRIAEQVMRKQRTEIARMRRHLEQLGEGDRDFGHGGEHAG